MKVKSASQVLREVKLEFTIWTSKRSQASITARMGKEKLVIEVSFKESEESLFFGLNIGATKSRLSGKRRHTSYSHFNVALFLVPLRSSQL